MGGTWTQLELSHLTSASEVEKGPPPPLPPSLCPPGLVSVNGETGVRLILSPCSQGWEKWYIERRNQLCSISPPDKSSIHKILSQDKQVSALYLHDSALMLSPASEAVKSLSSCLSQCAGGGGVQNSVEPCNMIAACSMLALTLVKWNGSRKILLTGPKVLRCILSDIMC